MSQDAKRFLEICSVQTAAVRMDISRIERGLSRVDAAIRKNLSDEEKIAGGLCEVRHQHKTLNDRLEEAGRVLSHYKSYLASFHS